MARRRLTLEEIELEIRGEHVCTSKRCHAGCTKRVPKPVRGFHAPTPARRRADVLRSACARGGAIDSCEFLNRVSRLYSSADPVSQWHLKLIRALDVELDSLA